MSTRVAIVGAGPAGAFAAAQLRSRGDGPEVDIFERLPTPWGLLRGGVAPDHFEIKELESTFDKRVLQRGCRFFGNVEIGRDIGHAELARHYHAVIYAVGAQTDRSLGIPGEDLPGSLPATDFVGWYNGHPDYRGLEPDLSHETAVVIGNGNVAADVARILLVPPDELATTDIADHALEALRSSSVKRVVILGRRGPAQAAFTSAELRELGRMTGVGVELPADIGELDPVSASWLEEEGTFTAKTNLRLLSEFAARPAPTEDKRLELRFLSSPLEIRGDGRVESLAVGANEIVRDSEGALRARGIEDAPEEIIEAGLVLRSVGYRAVPIPDVPFDDHSHVLPNVRGRVLDADTGNAIPGLYAVGWIKRGPTGILGTNKRDATETVHAFFEDFDAGTLAEPEEPSAEALDKLIAGLPNAVGVEGWRAIDAAERAAGAPEGRIRAKLADRDGLLAAART